METHTAYMGEEFNNRHQLGIHSWDLRIDMYWREHVNVSLTVSHTCRGSFSIPISLLHTLNGKRAIVLNAGT